MAFRIWWNALRSDVVHLKPKSIYWEICRKREAQKGAGWIRELERIGREVAQVIGVEVIYLGLDVPGEPAWKYGEAGPELIGT